MLKPTHTPTIDSFPCLPVMFFHLLAERLHIPLPRSRPSPHHCNWMNSCHLISPKWHRESQKCKHHKVLSGTWSPQFHISVLVAFMMTIPDEPKTTGRPTTRSGRPSTFIIVWLGGRRKGSRVKFHPATSCDAIVEDSTLHNLPLPGPYPSAWSLECTGCPIIILSRGAVSSGTNTMITWGTDDLVEHIRSWWMMGTFFC